MWHHHKQTFLLFLLIFFICVEDFDIKSFWILQWAEVHTTPTRDEKISIKLPGACPIRRNGNLPFQTLQKTILTNSWHVILLTSSCSTLESKCLSFSSEDQIVEIYIESSGCQNLPFFHIWPSLCLKSDIFACFENICEMKHKHHLYLNQAPSQKSHFIFTFLPQFIEF